MALFPPREPLLSETACQNPPVYYRFSAPRRPPWWRRGAFALAIAGAHLGALVFAFGVLERSPMPAVPPALQVRVIDAPLRPAAAPSPQTPQVPQTRHTPQAAQTPVKTPVKTVGRVATLPAKALPSARVLAVAENAETVDTARLANANPATVAVAPPAARPSAPAEPPAAAPSLPLVAARFDVAYLHNPRPAYPDASRRLGQEGRVVLRVRVSAQGLPVAVAVKQSSGFSRLDEAARAAVERWRFVPARRGDEAVESLAEVPLQFNLED